MPRLEAAPLLTELQEKVLLPASTEVFTELHDAAQFRGERAWHEHPTGAQLKKNSKTLVVAGGGKSCAEPTGRELGGPLLLLAAAREAAVLSNHARSMSTRLGQRDLINS